MGVYSRCFGTYYVFGFINVKNYKETTVSIITLQLFNNYNVLDNI